MGWQKMSPYSARALGDLTKIAMHACAAWTSCCCDPGISVICDVCVMACITWGAVSIPGVTQQGVG